MNSSDPSTGTAPGSADAPTRPTAAPWAAPSHGVALPGAALPGTAAPGTTGPEAAVSGAAEP
ncbi:hypothetical protein ABT341_31180, partial [Pseudonocardia alni]